MAELIGQLITQGYDLKEAYKIATKTKERKMNEHIEEIKDYATTKIQEYIDCGDEICGADLHHELFNTDYYIIGTYQAKQWLESYGVFDAIEKVMEYEKEQFGEVTTEIHDPEKLVNMLVYILGEEILQESETLRDKWDDILTTEALESIKEEII